MLSPPQTHSPCPLHLLPLPPLQRSNTTPPPRIRLPPLPRQRLRKPTPLPKPLALPIKDIDGDSDDDGDAGQDRRRVLERVFRVALEVGVEGRGVHGGDAGQEVAREAVAAGRGGGVGAVGGHHVVDCCHVDRVLGVS